MRKAVEMEIYTDLSEEAFEKAVAELGALGDIARVTLTCGDRNWGDAERIRQRHKCQVQAVTEELLCDPELWAVTWNGQTFWTKPK